MPATRLVLAIAALLAPTAAAAHELKATVNTAGDTVKVEAYFGGDFPAEFATVSVADASGAVVASGKTDERGVWSFPRPKPGTYTLTVDSGDGHIKKMTFPVGGADDPAATFTDSRLDKRVGLAVGVGGLLALSAASWLLRRRRRRLE